MRLVFPLLVASLSVGCAHQYQYTPGLALSGSMGVAPLERDQYAVLDPVEGEACRSYYMLFPLPIFWRQGALGRMGAIGNNYAPEGAVGMAAIADALKDQSGADAIIAPRWEVQVTSALPWYRETCVSVEARGISIKGDGE